MIIVYCVMPFSTLIQEDQIDQLLETLNDPIQVESAMKSLEQTAPKYMAYVFSEDSKLLQAAEQDLLTYITAVLWSTVKADNWADAGLSEEEIGEMEDKNWDLLQGAKAKTFRDRLDVFYEDYPQEDLLALVEDLLVVEEEDEISKEGRDHVFILCKTFLDILIA